MRRIVGQVFIIVTMLLLGSMAACGRQEATPEEELVLPTEVGLAQPAGQIPENKEPAGIGGEVTQEAQGGEATVEDAVPSLGNELDGGSIRVGVTYDTPNMNHLRAEIMSAAQELIFDTLVVRGPDGVFYPLLAESWEVTDNQLAWTFRLRSDVTFHDGTPFNAPAAKWFFDKARDPNGTHLFYESYAAVNDVLAPDDTTLIFMLNKPWPNILSTLSDSFAGLISPTAFEKYGDQYGDEYAVGTGPFMLESWTYQDETVIVRNPNYRWGPAFLANQGPPHISQANFVYLPESTTRVSELESQEVDYAYDIPARELSGIIESGEYNLYKLPSYGGSLYYIDLNQTKPPLNDQGVRQALNYAVDKQALASLLMGESGTPAFGYMASNWNCGVQDPEAIGYAYDSEKARELLTEAGWTDTNEDGVIDKDGRPFLMNMMTYDDDESKQYSELIKAQLAAVGINVQLEYMEYSKIVDRFEENENEMSLLTFGWADPDIYTLLFNSEQIPYLNSSHVNDSRMDSLIKLINSAPTAEEQCGYYAQIEQLAIEQAEWVPILWFTNILVTNKRLEGFLVTPYYVNLNDVVIRDID